MNSVAASLCPATLQEIAIQALPKSEPVSHLAADFQVSRKFVYQQADRAKQALDESFSCTADDTEVLFHLPVTKTWLFQPILALVPICHCSYRGVVELFRALFDLPISIGTIHNRLQSSSAIATGVNESQDLSGIDVGLHDEIYQGSSVDMERARALAKVLGYFPLALELAGAQVADGFVDWDELLDELNAEIASLEILDVSRSTEGGERSGPIRKRFSLLASFNLSLRRLSPEELQHFAWLGVLPEDVVITKRMAQTL